MADPGATATGFVIAAPSSGAGKTVTALGLIAAYRARGVRVRSGKVGPDYIDPKFHAAASGAPCFNLDGWAMRPPLVQTVAAEIAGASELFIIEGVMGLFDGAEGGRGSTAELAKSLGLPVVLVVDASRASRSIAALILGFQTFDPQVDVAGVIAVRVATDRHESMVRAAIAEIGLPCFGAVRHDPDLMLPSRHLGLVQAGEHDDLVRFLKQAGERMEQDISLDDLAGAARPLRGRADTVDPLRPLGQHIAVAQDQAFDFAYPHLLKGWRDAGAQLSIFSPLADEAPAIGCDAVFLPGGYPELHGPRLAAALNFKSGLAERAAAGALIYGECGGYMVLGEALVDEKGKTHSMAGLLPIVTSIERKSRVLGYRRLTQSGALPWGTDLRGHEFHYSAQTATGEGTEPLFAVTDAMNRPLPPLGAVRGRVMGSYAHVIDVA